MPRTTQSDPHCESTYPNAASGDAGSLIDAEVFTDATGVALRRIAARLTDDPAPLGLDHLGTNVASSLQGGPGHRGRHPDRRGTGPGECLYVEVFNSAAERRLALDRFIGYYNGQRPHLGIGWRTPRQRLTDLMAA
jgi:transposase InsO family protein